jgi:hypothetical protein
MLGAVIFSFGLLALAMLNLLCAPLIRCLASSRLFSVFCRFDTNSCVLRRPLVVAQLLRNPMT